MKRQNLLIQSSIALLTLFTLLFAIVPASAQSQTTMTQQDSDRDRDDITRRQLANFDQFLDGHPEVSEQLRKDPSLINNQEFIQSHAALQQYLKEHPEAREEFTQNPNRFMHQEERYDRREDNRDRPRELANLDVFLDSHPEIAEQLRKDPSLVNNKGFEEHHPALQQFLAEHPGVREEYTENPNRFMRQEDRYDRREDSGMHGDRDITHRQLANMDVFLDSHPEIAEQLHKDPSLVDNKDFEAHHPALQQFLAEHPGVREEFTENPNAFMHQENRYDRHEDAGMRRDHDVNPRELAGFNDFMENHNNISNELSKNPALAKNEEYRANHPDLQEYLKAHPHVSDQLNENPQAFLKSAQQFNTTQAQPTHKPDKADKMGSDPKLK